MELQRRDSDFITVSRSGIFRSSKSASRRMVTFNPLPASDVESKSDVRRDLSITPFAAWRAIIFHLLYSDVDRRFLRAISCSTQ